MSQNIELEQNIQKMNARFEAKKREEILVNVPEEFEDQINKAIDYENDEEYEKVAEICHGILATDKGKDIEQVKIILARIYPKLLRVDVLSANQRYQKDVENYLELLDGIKMNSFMQEYVVETLVRLCDLLENEWYRPLFREFLKRIEEKNYLSDDEYKGTLESAHASLESSLYFEDSRLSMMVKTALKSGYDRNYTLEMTELDEKKNSMMINILSSDYYICQYYSEHTDEFDLVEKEYPYSFSLISDIIAEIKENSDKKADEVLDLLMPYVSKGVSKEALKAAMDRSYSELLKKADKPQPIHTGKSTYYRNSEKIGRNDPCPCGSGLKFKKCCGK